MRLLVFAVLLLCSCTSLDTHFGAMGTRDAVCDEEKSWDLHVSSDVDHLQLNATSQVEQGRFDWKLVGPDGQTVTEGSCDSECEISQEWDSPAEGTWTLHWTLEEFVGSYHLELITTG